jgi:hypothetical protein
VGFQLTRYPLRPYWSTPGSMMRVISQVTSLSSVREGAVTGWTSSR